MNRFSLNGSSLNGGGASTLVLALAAVVCSASVTAETVRVVAVQGELHGAATLTSSLDYLSKASATIQGQALLSPFSTHTHKSNVVLHGSSQIVSYVLRDVPASAVVASGASIVAVVASTQGSASILGATSLVVAATRVQAAYAASPTYGEMVFSVAPVVFRNAETVLQGTAFFRAEPHLNALVDAYSYVEGTLVFEAAALCSRISTASFTGGTYLNVASTLIQPGYSSSFSSTQVTIATPNVRASLLANIMPSSTIFAEAYLIKQVQSTLESTALVVSVAKQEHSSNLVVAGTVAITTPAKVTSFLSANVQGETFVLSTASRVLIGEATALTSTNITAALSVVTLAHTFFTCEGKVVALADDINVRSISANAEILGEAGSQSNAEMFVVAFSDINVSAESESISEDLNTRHVNTFSLLTSEAYVKAEALRSLEAESTASVSVTFIGAADTVVREGQATFFGSGSINVVEQLTRLAYTQMNGSSNLTCNADRALTTSIVFTGTGRVYADTITNPESYDSEDRTFVREAESINFIRPFIETEFKRAA